MRKFGIILTAVTVICSILAIIGAIKSNYEYNKNFQTYWSLADKSSTISEKSRNIDIFVSQFEKAGLSGKYNAMFFKTPNNSFDANFKALKSLQGRLREVETMDIKSFEYQTAIQQITEQEQGEANQMLSELRGVWYYAHYPLLWDWVAIIGAIGTLILLILGIAFWIDDDWNKI